MATWSDSSAPASCNSVKIQRGLWLFHRICVSSIYHKRCKAGVVLFVCHKFSIEVKVKSLTHGTWARRIHVELCSSVWKTYWCLETVMVWWKQPRAGWNHHNRYSVLCAIQQSIDGLLREHTNYITVAFGIETGVSAYIQKLKPAMDATQLNSRRCVFVERESGSLVFSSVLLSLSWHVTFYVLHGASRGGSYARLCMRTGRGRHGGDLWKQISCPIWISFSDRNEHHATQRIRGS